MTLDLALITHKADGIERVARQSLPAVPGVRYVISWQNHGNAPVPESLASRPDVEIHRFDGHRQSDNRNNAIEHCKADIILHADDDVTYLPQSFESIINIFEANPDVDVATFRSIIYGSTRDFPKERTALKAKLPKNYYATTIEIAFRRATAGHLRFCPELGLNSPRFHGGEDEMFLMSAIKRGLRCSFFPITICEHPLPSTGSKSHFTNCNLQAAGAIIGLVTPLTAFLRVPLKAFRVARARQAGFLRALFCISRGAFAAPGLLRRNHNTLW